MASNNFKNLVARTRKAVTKRVSASAEADSEKTKRLLTESLRIQTEIKSQFKVLKRDYKKNKSIYDTLHNEIVLLRKKREKPKFTKVLNPWDKLKGGKGGGLLSSLMSAFGLKSLLLKPFMSMFTKGIGTIMKGVKASLTSLLRTAGTQGSRAIKALANPAIKGVKALSLKSFDSAKKKIRAAGELSKKGVKGALRLGANISRTGMRQVAGLIGRGIIGTAGAAIGYPLLIATAAAAVGYGTYKLGRYLKLSEKLDDFIKKVSSGKYNNLVDFILGMTNGTVGKELYGWVKDKISTMFTDSIKFLKEKTADILGKFSPFSKNTDDSEEKGNDRSVVGGAQASQQNANKGSGDISVIGGTDKNTDANADSNPEGSLWSRIKAGAGSAVQSVKEAFGGGTEAGPSNPDVVSSSNLAWKAITGGKKTQINSGYKTAKRPNHEGIDIDAEVGTPIYAIESGTFTRNTHSTGGKQAFVSGTPSGYQYGVAHLSGWALPNNTKVKAGDLIGYSGNTGRSTGPHIHFGMRKNGVRIDPTNVKTQISSSKEKGGHGIGDMGWPGDSSANVSAPQKNTFSIASSSSANSMSFMPGSNTAGFGGHGIEPDKVMMPEVLTKITNIVSGKDKDYIGLAKSFISLISKEDTENNNDFISQNNNQSSKTINPSMFQSQPEAAASSSNSVEGNTPGVLDPRGALNPEIVSACTSPLFL